MTVNAERPSARFGVRIAGVAAGAFVGVAVTLFYQRVVVQEVSASTAATRAVTPRASSEARALSEKAPRPSSEKAGSDEALDVNKLVEADREFRADLSRRIRLHFESARDPHWADSAESDFRDDFEDVCAKADSECSVQGSDCRTKTCVVTVAWPNRSAAEKTYTLLTNKAYKVNCAVAVSLPEPVAGGAAAQVTGQYFLDCMELREGSTGQQ